MNHILVVDDEAEIRNSLEEILREEGYGVATAATAAEALVLLQDAPYDVVLLDIWLPDRDGLDVLTEMHQLAQEMRPEVVIISGHGTIETAVKATKLGAYDFLEKPLSLDRTLIVLKNAVEARRLRTENLEFKRQFSVGSVLTGDSVPLKALRQQIRLMAPTNGRVLIYGESGTGKELIARAIYQHSARAKAPFIAINCAAIPENLLESELFGHERGAFTGADRRRIGRFEQANKGTLFLDEIGDLPPNTQVKLLRVLQQQTFERVGGVEPISVDVRVLAATHRNLEVMIREGKFREDLFHRLNVVCLQLPTLRERHEDIPVLVHHFLRKYAGDFDVESPTITPEAMTLLQSNSWPGNVRELENMVRRLLLDARGLSIGADAVRQVMAARNVETSTPGNSFAARARDFLERAQKGELQDAHAHMLAEAEREILTQAILLAEGNQAKAARWLGLSRFTLREKLRQLGLHPDST